MFVIRAFGGEVAYDGEGSPYSEADEAITHQVGRAAWAAWAAGRPVRLVLRQGVR
jgi:hypothetical protein